MKDKFGRPRVFKTEKWNVEDTQKFYMALAIFGTDFSMIERVFNEERNREQIKVSLFKLQFNLIFHLSCKVHLTFFRTNLEKKNVKIKTKQIPY